MICSGTCLQEHHKETCNHSWHTGLVVTLTAVIWYIWHQHVAKKHNLQGYVGKQPICGSILVNVNTESHSPEMNIHSDSECVNDNMLHARLHCHFNICDASSCIHFLSKHECRLCFFETRVIGWLEFEAPAVMLYRVEVWIGQCQLCSTKACSPPLHVEGIHPDIHPAGVVTSCCCLLMMLEHGIDWSFTPGIGTKPVWMFTCSLESAILFKHIYTTN